MQEIPTAPQPPQPPMYQQQPPMYPPPTYQPPQKPPLNKPQHNHPNRLQQRPHKQTLLGNQCKLAIRGL